MIVHLNQPFLNNTSRLAKRKLIEHYLVQYCHTIRQFSSRTSTELGLIDVRTTIFSGIYLHFTNYSVELHRMDAGQECFEFFGFRSSGTVFSYFTALYGLLCLFPVLQTLENKTREGQNSEKVFRNDSKAQKRKLRLPNFLGRTG